MRHFKNYCLLLILALLIVGCTEEAKEESKSDSALTIEHYKVSENEGALVRKTGVELIEFFKLNGSLNEEKEELQYSVEVYENGKFKEEILKSVSAPSTDQKDSILSFGVKDDAPTLEIIAGLPFGVSTAPFENHMTGHTFTTLVGKKITLEKDQPIYLAAWLGTKTNQLRTVGEEKGKLPKELEDYEVALLYKVLWTDKE